MSIKRSSSTSTNIPLEIWSKPLLDHTYFTYFIEFLFLFFFYIFDDNSICFKINHAFKDDFYFFALRIFEDFFFNNLYKTLHFNFTYFHIYGRICVRAINF